MTDSEKTERINPADGRITNILMRHWGNIRGTRVLPAESELDPAILEGILDNCFLIRAEGIPEGKYHYKYLGKNVMNAYGSDLTKRQGNDKENPLTYKKKIEQVLESKLPVIDEGEFVNVQGHLVKYRLCLVPLGTGDKVDSILGGMRFKIIEK